MNSAQKFSVVFVDAHVVVVVKDAGLLTTPAHGEESLIDLLTYRLDRENFGRHAPFVVHRLDRETSGLLAFGRTPKAATALAKQFAAHSVERRYEAIVAGRVEGPGGTFAAALDGKRAVTHYLVERYCPGATLVSVRLETGRRNQIRRHFAAAGNALLGETRFGVEAAAHPAWRHPRLALHAAVLGFRHPAENRDLRFEAPVPREFTDFFDAAEDEGRP